MSGVMHTTKPCDLLIVGGGPAGLSAAINGASEGLTVTVLDSNKRMGGQAVESRAIENYPGFVNGITGTDLMNALVDQAYKFDANLVCPADAAMIDRQGGLLHITTTDYRVLSARAVLLSLGLHYRTLEARRVDALLGRGVYYGMPPEKLKRTNGCSIVIVGGANSAGQAAVYASNDPKMQVTLVARRAIKDTMSQYLIDRLRQRENVRICEGCTVRSAHGTDKLEEVMLSIDGSTGETMRADYMLIFIGAMPRTLWLRNSMSLDVYKYVNTWTDLVPCEGQRAYLPYETSMLGVFAAGDVRSGSTKRVASAVGEGAAALQMIHRYLSREARG